MVYYTMHTHIHGALSQQPGSMYSLTPQVCHLITFLTGRVGINQSATGQGQPLELACAQGKGSNAIILSFQCCTITLQHYGLGERGLQLHAEHLLQPEQNRCMLEYLVWRVSCLDQDYISFQFSPDWCFQWTRVGNQPLVSGSWNEFFNCISLLIQ